MTLWVKASKLNKPVCGESASVVHSKVQETAVTDTYFHNLGSSPTSSLIFSKHSPLLSGLCMLVQRYGGTELGEQTGALQPQLGTTEQAIKACCSIVVLTGANAPCSAPWSSLAPYYTNTLHMLTETGHQELRDRNRYTETLTKQERAWRKVSDKVGLCVAQRQLAHGS